MRIKGCNRISVLLNCRGIPLLKRGEGNHYPPHTEAVHQQRQTEVLGKINHFLEKAVEDTHGRYQAWWDDEDHRKKKDELERVEEEMYRGWSL